MSKAQINTITKVHFFSQFNPTQNESKMSLFCRQRVVRTCKSLVDQIIIKYQLILAMSKVVVAKKKRTVERRFEVDCSKPVEDKVLSTSTFADFLRQRIKIGGKTGKLEDTIKVTSEDKKIVVVAQVEAEEKNEKRGGLALDRKVNSTGGFSKRYLKYLTKKFLKKNALREFLYVVASSKANYVIKYFNIQQEGNETE